jgi:hypothetical protein
LYNNVNVLALRRKSVSQLLYEGRQGLFLNEGYGFNIPFVAINTNKDFPKNESICGNMVEHWLLFSLISCLRSAKD